MSKYFEVYMQKWDKNEMLGFIGFFGILIIFQAENNKLTIELSHYYRYALCHCYILYRASEQKCLTSCQELVI